MLGSPLQTMLPRMTAKKSKSIAHATWPLANDRSCRLVGRKAEPKPREEAAGYFVFPLAFRRSAQ